MTGLPLHPLVVHAPVVLLPLVAAGLVLMLVRPALRRPLAPIVAVLAVAAAVTSIGATWTGDQLGDTLGRGDELDPHRSWGEITRTLAVVVAILTVAFAAADRFWARRPTVAGIAGVAATGLALAAVVAVAVTGHAGATLAWESELRGSASEDDAASEDGVEPVSGAGPDAAPDAATSPEDDAGRGTSLPGTGAPGVDVVLGEWALVTSVEEVAPGTITFRFQNRGTVAHALRIRTPGSGGDRLEWRSETVEPGDVGLLVADLGPGTYELDCPVEDAHGDHDQLGMETLFEVRDGAEPAAPLPAGDDPDPAANDAGAEESGDGAAREADGVVTVDIAGFSFEPAQVRVASGTEVVWGNGDPAPHTATGDGFDTGRIETGAASTVLFETPGTFEYVCSIHPTMRGSLVVDP